MVRGPKTIPGRARKQSQMSKNNPKISKTIKNDTGAAFGGAPGALRAPGSVICDCFAYFGIVFVHV